jgi:hypothetical protein
MLTFFSVRALIAAGKLTDRTSDQEYKFITYPNKSKIVDDYTKYGIDDVFDLHSGTEKNLSLKLLTHQFVDACVIFTGVCAARFAVRRFPGWKLVPPKWRCLVPRECRDGAQSHPPVDNANR